MRCAKIIAVAGVSLLIAGCQTGQNEDTAKILSELKDIKTRLDKIDTELKKKNTEMVSQFNPNVRANVEALNKIKLPDNPTRDNVKKYIEEIKAATKNQNSFSSEDPQVAMYRKLDEKFLDLMLDAAKNDGRSFHLMYAINAMTFSAASKSLILKELKKKPELISTVIRQGWEADAKDAIKNMLLYPRNGGYVPTEAVQAAAQFNDPEMKEAIVNYFIVGNNRQMTFRIMKMTPGIKIDDDTIEKAWNQAIMSHDYERNAMAAIAIGYGHKNALESLLDRNPKMNFGGDYDFQCNSAIRTHVDVNGSMDEIKKWYEINRDKIVFDPADKKFKVKKADAPKP